MKGFEFLQSYITTLVIALTEFYTFLMSYDEDKWKKEIGNWREAVDPHAKQNVKKQLEEAKKKTELQELKQKVDKNAQQDTQQKSGKPEGVGNLKKEEVETAQQKPDPKQQQRIEKLKKQIEQQQGNTEKQQNMS